MVGFAANHRAEGNQRVKLFAVCQILQHQRYFQCAGHGRQRDVVVVHAQFDEFFPRHFNHGAADFVGETCLHNADAQTSAV